MGGDAEPHPEARSGPEDLVLDLDAEGRAGVERGRDLAVIGPDAERRGAGHTPSPVPRAAGPGIVSSPRAWTPAAKYLATTSSVGPWSPGGPGPARSPSRHRRVIAAMLWLTNSTVRPCLRHVAHLAEALALERGVADGQHLVDDQDLRLEVRRDGEGEPHVHAARVALDRRVEELLDLGEGDDLVELAIDLGLAHAEDGAVEVDVLAAGQLGVEAGADLQQRADAARRSRPARRSAR